MPLRSFGRCSQAGLRTHASSQMHKQRCPAVRMLRDKHTSTMVSPLPSSRFPSSSQTKSVSVRLRTGLIALQKPSPPRRRRGSARAFRSCIHPVSPARFWPVKFPLQLELAPQHSHNAPLTKLSTQARMQCFHRSVPQVADAASDVVALGSGTGAGIAREGPGAEIAWTCKW